MATDTPKPPKPAKPLDKPATTAAPNAATTAPDASPPPSPKPAKPKKGPIMDTSTIATSDTPDTPEAAVEAPETAAEKPESGLNPTKLFKDNAAKFTKDAGDKARAYAEDGKARAGGALDELARLITEASGTVDDKLGAQYGEYARSAAGAVTGLSDSIKAKNLDDLIEDARGFVKKSPAVAIGTAAALGFVLVRLVKAGLDAAEPDDA